jgi:sulfhydrogenase subunit alpha
MKTRTISVEALGRIEGEAGLTLRLREGAVADVRLNVFEPPRFFEALLRGRASAASARWRTRSPRAARSSTRSA